MAVSLNKLAQAVDQYYQTREARLKLDREAAEMKKEETRLKAFLIENISKSDASGVAGKLMRATIKTDPVPTVEAWPDLYKYIKKTDSFDLLQRRLSNPAVVERWEDGKIVAGVGKIQVVSISLSKL